MSNFLSGITTYGEPWSVVKRESFDETDKAAIDHAEVIQGKEYETRSVAFFLKSGGFQPVPLDKDGQDIPVGTRLDLDSMECLTLQRGSETCRKIHIK